MDIKDENCLTRSNASMTRWIGSFKLSNSISVLILRDPIYLCTIDETLK